MRTPAPGFSRRREAGKVPLRSPYAVVFFCEGLAVRSSEPGHSLNFQGAGGTLHVSRRRAALPARLSRGAAGCSEVPIRQLGGLAYRESLGLLARPASRASGLTIKRRRASHSRRPPHIAT